MTEATFEERLEAFEARVNARLSEAEERSTKLERGRDEYEKLGVLLQEQVERLKLGLLGQKAERLPKMTRNSRSPFSISRSATTHSRRPPRSLSLSPSRRFRLTLAESRQKPLFDTLPRVAIEILPPEVQVEGLKLVGADTREVLERRLASCVIVAITCKSSFAKILSAGLRPKCSPPPALELPIERGLAEPSMLADTIVRLWQDHQPLTRLEEIYRREQLDLAKSTLCTWHERLADLARPLVEAMFEDAYREPYLCVALFRIERSSDSAR